MVKCEIGGQTGSLHLRDVNDNYCTPLGVLCLGISSSGTNEETAISTDHALKSHNHTCAGHLTFELRSPSP